ncbi:MAG: 30S ribosomal protein S9 [Acidobacteria bacterium]|nr:30S ribosomal protein S9 [Acidobacteriota bacterium]MCH8990382.1 30S ribosomal protein S9 [Acidobacteriota bacterium]
MTQPLIQATGRRKSSVARVRFVDGTGAFVINGDRSLDDYFPQAYRRRVQEPFEVVDYVGRYDVHATLHGGGLTGQSDALRLGIARALVGIDAELRPTLKKAGMLRRDDRKVERKKYGLRKARRAPQFTKR